MSSSPFNPSGIHHFVLNCASPSFGNSWILDSGATDHVCNSPSWFTSHYPIKPIQVRLPNDHYVLANIAGTVSFPNTLTLTNVLYVPNFSFNLISISQLTSDQRYSLTFSSNGCQIQDMRCMRMIGSVSLVGGLYYLLINQVAGYQRLSSLPRVNHVSSISQNRLWHYRLGHPSSQRMSLISQEFPFVKFHKVEPCDICQFARQKRLSYAVSNSRASRKFELLHFDIWGPFSVHSIHGHKFFLTVVDDFTRFTWVILLKSKSEVQNSIRSFIKFVETQFDTNVKVIRSDNGAEFLMSDFYLSRGIIHQTSCPETPQQNGRVERKHQHILNVARALLFQSNLPKPFWSYSVVHAVFLINRVPTPILQNCSPYELLYESKPDLSTLKTFGGLCFASTLTASRTKFDHRSKKCVFLGFRNGVKGFVLFDMSTHQIFVSRNVVFYDHILPYGAPSPAIDIVTETTPPSPTSHASPHHSDNGLPLENNLATSESPPLHPSEPQHSPDTAATDEARVSSRVRRPPSYLADYQSNSVTNNTGTDLSSSSPSYPINQYISYSNLSNTHKTFALTISADTEPKSYTEACKLECWNKAMQAEISALEQTKTWIVVDLPPGVVPIGNKWVYKIKRKADGSIERYKARLVAKGYTQIEGIDYFDTFSPVAKMTTIRLLLAVAAIKGWHLHQLDVNNAFLHGDLHEEVYMHLPLGFHSPGPNKVCKLLKSLYGLKQASRQWFAKLSSLLLTSGYCQAHSDPSLFTKRTASSFTALLVYVDDIILAGDCLTEFAHIKQILDTKFKIKDLGQAKYFLGLEIAHSKKKAFRFLRENTAWSYCQIRGLQILSLPPLHLTVPIVYITIRVALSRM